jgi:hypothetical protein
LEGHESPGWAQCPLHHNPDGRTVRFPDTEIKVGDSIEFNLKTGNNEEF